MKSLCTRNEADRIVFIFAMRPGLNQDQHMRLFTVLQAILLCFTVLAQEPVEERIRVAEAELTVQHAKQEALRIQLEELKLERVRELLKARGLPAIDATEEVIFHSAMALVYSEEHEQAKWVAHIITPDVISGNTGRTNDFRPDPKIKTGSAVEQDYFKRIKKPDGKYGYEGFGFDRGHLAPSADFRWSATALSESYYYSNMSPQRPEFNRVSWAKLEDMLRSYVEENVTDLYVVTGPLLRDGLPKVEKSVNKISIPVYYYKVALDPAKQRGIAFLMPNRKAEYPIEHYAISIDSLESLTGIDFFPALPDEQEDVLEAMTDVKPFLSAKEQKDAKPLNPAMLPRNHFNTIQARAYVGRNDRINVCGTVVSTRRSAKGNIFLNLDKAFPNQIFTVSIFADKTGNFSYAPEEFLAGKVICVEGKVTDFNGTPSLALENEQQIVVMEELP